MTKKELFKLSMKQNRGLDFPEIGMTVEMGGRTGIIKGMNHGCNLIVQTNSGKESWHPTWNICYYDSDGRVVRDYREATK